jgi:hypothetical protein
MKSSLRSKREIGFELELEFETTMPVGAQAMH